MDETVNAEVIDTEHVGGFLDGVASRSGSAATGGVSRVGMVCISIHREFLFGHGLADAVSKQPAQQRRLNGKAIDRGPILGASNCGAPRGARAQKQPDSALSVQDDDPAANVRRPSVEARNTTLKAKGNGKDVQMIANCGGTWPDNRTSQRFSLSSRMLAIAAAAECSIAISLAIALSPEMSGRCVL
jgi:hypothetical protein